MLSRLDRHLHELVARGERAPAERMPASGQAVGAVLDALAAFFGMVDRTMLHDIAWHFFQAGVWLERAIMTGVAVQHVIGDLEQAARTPGREEADLSAFVRLMSSQDAYRRTYQARAEPLFVAELFLANEHAPKSMHACARALLEHIAAISRLTGGGEDAPLTEVRALLAEFGRVELRRFFPQRSDSPRIEPARSDAVPPGAPSPPSDVASLHVWLQKLQGRFAGLNASLQDFYFSHQARLQSGPPGA